MLLAEEHMYSWTTKKTLTFVWDEVRKYTELSRHKLMWGFKQETYTAAENDDKSGSTHILQMVPCNYTFCKSKRELKQIEDRGFDGGCLCWLFAWGASINIMFG